MISRVFSTICPCAFDLLSFMTQKSRPNIADAATAAATPMPALAPVLRPLLGEARELAVATVDEGVEVIDVDVAGAVETDEELFGFCWVTVRLGRIKYP